MVSPINGWKMSLSSLRLVGAPELIGLPARSRAATGGTARPRGSADGTWGGARGLGPLANTDRARLCAVVSPDGWDPYLTRDRGFADEPLKAALSTRESSTRLDERGDSWRGPRSAVFEALGRTPRCATPCR
jgi:hypothetical protein